MAEESALRAAEANGSAVGARSRVGAAAIGRAADELGKVSEASAQAAAAFIKTSRQARTDADGHARAAEACEPADIAVSGRAAPRTAVAALELAPAMPERSTSTIMDACGCRRLACRRAANAAKRKTGCCDWGGGPPWRVGR